jgi:hypothetical protein
MTTSINTDIINTENIEAIANDSLPVYVKYARQHAPQSAYLEMDEDGVISVETENLGGGQSSKVWYNRTLQFPLPPTISGIDLEAFVDKHKILLAQIYAGHDVEWDGRNHVGVLDAQATEHCHKLYQICEHHCAEYQRDVYEPADFIANDDLPVFWDPGMSIDEAVDHLIVDAKNHDYVISGTTADVKKALLDRAMLNFEDDGDLTETQVQALVDDERIDENQATTYRDERSLSTAPARSMSR